MADPKFANPFVKKETPTPPPAATPAAPKAPKAEAGDKKKRSPELTSEQMSQIIALIKTGQKSYAEIAEEVGVTRFQVNRVLMSVKKKLKAAAEANPAAAPKIQQIIESLKRPAETRPGAKGAKGGKVAAGLDDLVKQLIAGL